MPLISPVQSGLSYGASFVSDVTKAAKNAVSGTASTTAKVATGFAKAAMFATIPNSSTVGIGVGLSTWYANRMATTYASQVITKLCVQATTRVVGPTVGPYLATAVVAPLVVPVVAPAAIIVATGTTFVVATTLGNAMHHYASQKEVAKSKDAAKTANLDISDFVMIDVDVGAGVASPAA